MTDLISNSFFKDDTHKDQGQAYQSTSNDPRKAVFTVSGDEGQRRSKENDETHHDVDPGGVGVRRDNWEKKGKECHHDTVNNASRRKCDA